MLYIPDAAVLHLDALPAAKGQLVRDARALTWCLADGCHTRRRRRDSRPQPRPGDILLVCDCGPCSAADLGEGHLVACLDQFVERTWGVRPLVVACASLPWQRRALRLLAMAVACDLTFPMSVEVSPRSRVGEEGTAVARHRRFLAAAAHLGLEGWAGQVVLDVQGVDVAAALDSERHSGSLLEAAGLQRAPQQPGDPDTWWVLLPAQVPVSALEVAWPLLPPEGAAALLASRVVRSLGGLVPTATAFLVGGDAAQHLMRVTPDAVVGRAAAGDDDLLLDLAWRTRVPSEAGADVIQTARAALS